MDDLSKDLQLARDYAKLTQEHLRLTHDFLSSSVERAASIDSDNARLLRQNEDLRAELDEARLEVVRLKAQVERLEQGRERLQDTLRDVVSSDRFVPKSTSSTASTLQPEDTDREQRAADSQSRNTSKTNTGQSKKGAQKKPAVVDQITRSNTTSTGTGSTKPSEFCDTCDRSFGDPNHQLVRHKAFKLILSRTESGSVDIKVNIPGSNKAPSSGTNVIIERQYPSREKEGLTCPHGCREHLIYRQHLLMHMNESHPREGCTWSLAGARK